MTRKTSLAQFAQEVANKVRRRHFDARFLVDLAQLDKYSSTEAESLDSFLRVALYAHSNENGASATRRSIDGYFQECEREI